MAIALLAMLGMLRLDRAVIDFVAYDCSNSSNRMDAYSLLESAVCPTTEHHGEVEWTIFGETVQMTRDQTVPVFCCTVIKSLISQY